jgi:positive regulator of sigma E activity
VYRVDRYVLKIEKGESNDKVSCTLMMNAACSNCNHERTCFELLEERKQVNQQQMKTPGRRGEVIKHEEISNEMSRRLLSRG